MKYAAYGLLAAFLAAAVYGAIPDTAAGWYTPDKFSVEVASGILEVQTTDEYGNTDTIEYPVYVDENGYVVGVDGADLTDVVLDSVSYKALQAFVLAERNKERIETIGKNLHNLGLADGIDIVGTDPNGNEHRYTMRFTLGSGIRDSLDDGSRPELTDPTAGWNMADEKTLHWRTNNKMELTGADTATTSTDEWWNDYGFFVPFLKGTGALGWKKYGGWYDGVFGTMTSDGRTMLTLAGWTGGHECGTDMNSILTEENGDNRANHYVLTRYGTGSDAVFHYVPFGDRLETGGGAPVDGKSITTNTTDGAITSGEVSLRGFASQSEWAIPYKHGEGAEGELWWRTPDMWCGPSLEWGEDGNGNKKFNVAGANDYAGKHAKHYFGTSNDKSATLGWHELPNVTTNRVEGDEATIASTVDEQDPGLKRLGLRGWNYQYGGDPLFVVNAGGSIGYIPLPALTNLAACACSNKWTRTLEWIGDGEVGDDGLTFESADLDHYLYGTLGYIYSTTPDNLYFDNDGEQIEASFTAPSNWADGDSVELTSEGAYQVAGWADASACAASMSAMLSSPEGSDATTHLLLAKKTDTGELHYVSIGDGVKSGAEVDDTTITTNTAHGATAQGVASIYGWSVAANDTYLSKNGSGNLEWRKVDPVPGVDDASIVTNTAKHLTLKGYAAAENNAVPMKTAQGLSWLKASSATNLILAGAGINITDNGGGAITISAQSYESESSSDTIRTLTVVTAVRYDETTHKFQKKTRQLVFKGSLGTESGWTDVFEAVSHKSEHGVE